MFIPFLKKFVGRMSIAVVITTICSAAGITYINKVIDSRFDDLQRKNVNVAENTGLSEPANFLLIGSDTRSLVGNSEDEGALIGADTETGQRSDTMMIIHVDPKSKKTSVLAIPRDTLVDIPGIGKKKINASFNEDLGGGPDKVVETIKTNFDIPIQHYVELDFVTFRQVVDALGTVNVYFPAPARDKKTGLNTNGKSGCIALNGEQSLKYVRSRYYEQLVDGKWQIDGTSNYGRIARQQEFMKRVASIAVRKSLTDPLKGRDVVDAIIKNLKVDQNFKKNDIFKLMNAFNGVDPNDPERVAFEVLPVKPDMIGGQSVDVIQSAEAETMLEMYRNFDSSSASKAAEVTLPRPATVKLRVLNASSKKGLAADVMSSMQSEGFVPAGTGNASSRSVTEIHYTSSNKNDALLVSKYIKGTLVQDTSIADADIVVMLGSDFQGVNVAGDNAVNSPKSTTTTTKPQSSKPPKNGIVETPACPA